MCLVGVVLREVLGAQVMCEPATNGMLGMHTGNSLSDLSRLYFIQGSNTNTHRAQSE